MSKSVVVRKTIYPEHGRPHQVGRYEVEERHEDCGHSNFCDAVGKVVVTTAIAALVFSVIFADSEK